MLCLLKTDGRIGPSGDIGSWVHTMQSPKIKHRATWPSVVLNASSMRLSFIKIKNNKKLLLIWIINTELFWKQQVHMEN